MRKPPDSTVTTNRINEMNQFGFQISQPDNPEPITHIGLCLGSKKGGNDIPFDVRVLPTGKEGNKVFGRTLRFGEEDSGEGIVVEDGETLIFPPKSVAFDIRDVDSRIKSERHGWGDVRYRNISPTLYLWQFINPNTGKEHYALLNLLLSVARRLDVGYALYEKSYSYLHDMEEDAPNEEILSNHVKGWGLVEALIILLYRCAVMLERLYEELGKKEIARDIAIPPGFSEITSKLLVFRNSIEHIDERAYGKINPSKKDPQIAHSIFIQNEFFSSGILRYGGDKLDIGNDVLQFLIKTRTNLLLLGSHLMGSEVIYEGEFSFSL